MYVWPKVIVTLISDEEEVLSSLSLWPTTVNYTENTMPVSSGIKFIRRDQKQGLPSHSEVFPVEPDKLDSKIKKKKLTWFSIYRKNSMYWDR